MQNIVPDVTQMLQAVFVMRYDEASVYINQRWCVLRLMTSKRSVVLRTVMVANPVQRDQVLFDARLRRRLVVAQWTDVAISTGEELGSIWNLFAEPNVLKRHHIRDSPERLKLLLLICVVL